MYSKVTRGIAFFVFFVNKAFGNNDFWNGPFRKLLFDKCMIVHNKGFTYLGQ